MKKVFTVLFLLVLLTVSFSLNNMVYADAADGGFTDGGAIPVKAPDVKGTVDPKIQQTTKNIWATISVLVQIASVACVVFAGLRYMYASSDKKADIKQGLTYLTIGAILVFGATLIINLVMNGFNEIV